MNWPYLACVVPLHAVMFGAAVAWTCLLRRPVLGAMAAIVSFAMVAEIIHGSDAAAHSFDPTVIYSDLVHGYGGANLASHAGYPVVAAGMAVIFVASILIAALALRRYDPRRQSG